MDSVKQNVIISNAAIESIAKKVKNKEWWRKTDKI
jgi:hypothetical protein